METNNAIIFAESGVEMSVPDVYCQVVHQTSPRNEALCP